MRGDLSGLWSVHALLEFNLSEAPWKWDLVGISSNWEGGRPGMPQVRFKLQLKPPPHFGGQEKALLHSLLPFLCPHPVEGQGILNMYGFYI